jgi:hypothetical protein
MGRVLVLLTFVLALLAVVALVGTGSPGSGSGPARNLGATAIEYG